jgi:predicted transcriptional regulator of viral defense system
MNKFQAFLEQYPVFSLEELKAFLGEKVSGRRAYNLLSHNRSMGRVGMVKQGVYYRVRLNESPQKAPVDPYLVASKLSPDSILGYHTAFELLGVGHSRFNRLYYLTQTPRRAFTFRNVTFQAVQMPRVLVKKNSVRFGTEKTERLGQKITIMGKERTLVDCLERPEYGGGWEEVYRCAEKLPFLNFDVLAEYLDLRAQKVLFAKVGFFLEQHREAFFVEEDFLTQLEKRVPKQPVYLEGRNTKGRLLPRWNLVVPEPVLNRTWEEF